MLVALVAFVLLLSAAWASPSGNAFFSGSDSTGFVSSDFKLKLYCEIKIQLVFDRSYAKTAINTNLPSGATPRSVTFWFLVAPSTDSAASPVPVPVDGFFSYKQKLTF
jgi:hypothetical protein